MKTNFLPLWATGLLLSFSLLTSCKEDLEQTAPAQPATIISADSSGIVKQGKLNGQPITYMEINGEAVWQGDILLAPEQLAEGTAPNTRTSGAGRSSKYYRWPDAVIPYEIASGADQTPIKQAIAHWEENTPIDFVPRTNQTDYVRFVKANVNSSYVGKVGGMQEIKLQNLPSVGTVIHEIGHAVGLHHEQSRADQLDWVTVNYHNIEPLNQFNFYPYNPGTGFDGGKALDFNSIMLYGSYFFSKNGQPTLTRKDGTTWTSNTTHLSGKDRGTVELMYANLYIGWFDGLYGVNTKVGSYKLVGAGYKGSAKTIAEDNEYIWSIQGNGNLQKTNRFSGEISQTFPFGTGAVGLTGEDPQGVMYAQQGIRLWKINKFTGARTRLGGVNALENWSGTQALYYHNNGLYIVWKNTLYKINRTTGLVDKTYGGYWSDVKGIAAPYGSSQFIYIMQGSELWRVNTDTGAFTLVKGGFSKVTAMSGVGGNLFIVSGDNLYRVSESGSMHFLSSGWEGATSMGAIHNANGLF